METFRDPGITEKGVDLRVVARRQRLLIWVIFAVLMSSALFCVLPNWVPSGAAIGMTLIVFLLLGLQITVIVCLCLFMHALKTHPVLLVICALLSLLPLVNLLILLAENNRATKLLRRAGVRVGFFGASEMEVELKLSMNVCRQCGYNLLGNVSGRCPECGTEIPAAAVATPPMARPTAG